MGCYSTSVDCHNTEVILTKLFREWSGVHLFLANGRRDEAVEGWKTLSDCHYIYMNIFDKVVLDMERHTLRDNE